MRQQGINGLRSVHAGSCHAWPLPADATCATVARQVFRDVVSEVGLEADLLDDCILMASELAANTLHARAVAGPGGGGDRFVSVAPDMGGEPISSAGPVPHTPRDPAAFAGAQPVFDQVVALAESIGRPELAGAKRPIVPALRSTECASGR